MNIPWRNPGSHRERTVGWGLHRQPRSWPALLRAVLVAVVAVVGFALIGPMATATAAPRPPHPTSDSSGDEPSRWQGLKWFMYESLVGGALDPHDPKYKPKLGWQGFVQLVLKKMGGDSLSLSVSDTPKLVGGVLEYHHRSQGTLPGLRKQLTKAAGEIHDLTQKAAQARTDAEREEIGKDLEAARKAYKYKFKQYLAVKETQPDAESAEAKIQGLDRRISDLKDKVSSLEEETKKARPGRREKVRQLKTARVNLAEAEAERRRLQEPPDDDDDTPGTRTTPRDPKKPPKGPASTGPTAKSTPTTNSTTANATTQTRASKSTTATGPSASWRATTSLKGWRSVKVPRTGFRGGTGTHQMTDAIAAVIADGISQDYAAYLDRRNQQLLEQARNNPDLRKRIIDDYNEIKDNNEIEVLFRSFEHKGFTQGATREIAPELIKQQKALDTAKAVAAKSNADPLYQRARRECGGYDTCVRERTHKLRQQNVKAIAESTRKAKKSNADPLYQQARTECGGYDTCVRERTHKLRQQNAKAIAESTRKAKKSNADPLYQQARRECGGYDTCVTDRTHKLRDQKERAAATPTTPHGQRKPHKDKTQTKPADYRGKGAVRASAT
ncbi:hypothetical protein [Streptomyces sp. TLI_146]|uniref:hypothetical protein n=1 Tax=Streptomyces sp. TLI_146 TaxID=1938858 RepID=UPI000C71589E|nr:hypothetical protein [Streptomyces sp. TLI_146]PKV82977.1 hypothetical protein BX283_0461 [Streptomyces sp. TLI_146]